MLALNRAAAAAALALSSVVMSADAAVVLQPGPETAKDSFVYQFLPGFNFNGAGWNHLLATGATNSGHNLEGLIAFDLTGVTLAPDERATLNLYAVDTNATGFGVSPTPAAPIVADLHAATSNWDPATVTWATKPTYGPLADSLTVSGVNQWISFDVTEEVSAWLANPSSNFGFVVRQNAPVDNNGRVMGVYQASGAPANRPYLEIAPIPEPASLAGVVAAFGLLLRRRRSA
jgi:hypothetical protein